MFCPNCGARLPDDSVFCESCGTRLDTAPQEAPQPVPQPSAPPQGAPGPESIPSPAAFSAQAEGAAPKKRTKPAKGFPVKIAVILALVLALGGIGIAAVNYFSQTGISKMQDRNSDGPELLGMRIEPQKLCESGDLTVWANGISFWQSRDDTYYEIWLHVENHGLGNIWLYIPETAVNGIPIESSSLESFFHGRSGRDDSSYIISISNLRNAGIDRIETITFTLKKAQYGLFGLDRYKGDSTVGTFTIRVT